MSKKTTKELALKLVGTDGFSFNRDQIINAFALIEKIEAEANAIVQAQAEIEAQAEVDAAEERFNLVDQTFKACPSRFLWKRGKSVLMVIVSEANTSDAAEAEFAQELAPLGDIKRYLDSQTVDGAEVFYTSVDLRGLNLPKNLDATEYGGIYHRVTAGLASVLADGGDEDSEG